MRAFPLAACAAALCSTTASAQTREQAQATLARHSVAGKIVLANGARDGSWAMERPVTNVVTANACETDFAAPRTTRRVNVATPANNMHVQWGDVTDLAVEGDAVRFTTAWVGAGNHARIVVADPVARAEVATAIRALVQSCRLSAGPATATPPALPAPAAAPGSAGRPATFPGSWRLLGDFPGTQGNRELVYYNSGRISASSDTVSVQFLKIGQANIGGVRTVVTTVRFECQRPVYTYTAAQNYDARHRPVATAAPPASQLPLPDSGWFRSIRNAVCAGMMTGTPVSGDVQSDAVRIFGRPASRAGVAPRADAAPPPAPSGPPVNAQAALSELQRLVAREQFSDSVGHGSQTVTMPSPCTIRVGRSYSRRFGSAPPPAPFDISLAHARFSYNGGGSVLVRGTALGLDFNDAADGRRALQLLEGLASRCR